MPFPIPFSGTSYEQISISSNGYVSIGSGTIEVFRDDLTDDFNNPSSGVYVNDNLPGRLVVTWFKLLRFGEYESHAQKTFQLTLFSDGRIQLGYQGINGAYEAEVAVLPDFVSEFVDVDFSARTNYNLQAEQGVYESFSPPFRPYDVDGGFVIFTPDGADGYDVRVCGHDGVTQCD